MVRIELTLAELQSAPSPRGHLHIHPTLSFTSWCGSRRFCLRDLYSSVFVGVVKCSTNTFSMVGGEGLEPSPVGLQPTALPVKLTSHKFTG